MLYNIVQTSTVTRESVYMCPSTFEPLLTHHLVPPSRGCHRAARLSSPCSGAASNHLSLLHMLIKALQCYSPQSAPTLSFPYCVHKPVLDVCFSIPPMHIGSSVPFFYNLWWYVALIYSVFICIAEIYFSMYSKI